MRKIFMGIALAVTFAAHGAYADEVSRDLVFTGEITNGICRVENTSVDFGMVSAPDFESGKLTRPFTLSVQCDGPTVPVGISFSAEQGIHDFRMADRPGVGIELAMHDPGNPAASTIVDNGRAVSLDDLPASMQFNIPMTARLMPVQSGNGKPFLGDIDQLITVNFIY
jgi:type 1 fimbria pilin